MVISNQSDFVTRYEVCVREFVHVMDNDREKKEMSEIERGREEEKRERNKFYSLIKEISPLSHII